MPANSAKNLSAATDPNEQPAALPPGWLARWPWVTFLLPMIVYMAVGSFEPKPPPPGSSTSDSAEIEDSILEKSPEKSPSLTSEDLEEALGKSDGLFSNIDYKYYPCIYTGKIALTLIAMVLVWPGYATFPWRVSSTSVVVGVVGVVLWIVLCQLQLELKLVGPIDRALGNLFFGEPTEDSESTIGLMSILGAGERSAYNPFAQMDESPKLAALFLVIRFLGLALVVPIIEEFFLRGFLMRYVVHENWWLVPFGSVNRLAVIVGTAIPMLMHPGELLAALVWFSMVTWLMVRTRNIWDCVVAHAVTNGLLGVYVVASGEWQLM